MGTVFPFKGLISFLSKIMHGINPTANSRAMSLYFFTGERIFLNLSHERNLLCRRHSVDFSSPFNALLMYFFPITGKPIKLNDTMSKNVDKFVIGKSVMQLETMATARQLVNINCCISLKNAAFSKKICRH